MSGEHFKLRCYVCHSEIEIPTTLRECVRCGATFAIDWDAERQAYEMKSEPRIDVSRRAKEREHAA
jgi:rRNA maturation endonuclease Nob1